MLILRSLWVLAVIAIKVLPRSSRWSWWTSGRRWTTTTRRRPSRWAASSATGNNKLILHSVQCDQIGPFLKYLVGQFSYKSSHNMQLLGGYIENVTFKIKLLWILLEKFGCFLFKHLVTLLVLYKINYHFLGCHQLVWDPHVPKTIQHASLLNTVFWSYRK